jgi:membrane-anchored mycosin MYCP
MLRAGGAAVAAAALLAANCVAPPAALAIDPPVIDPGALPPNDTPGPPEEMKQNYACANPVVVGDPDIGQPAPGNMMLDIRRAWQYSTGAGVSVGLIDTGVTPNPRFPALFAGGDYVMGLRDGGLTDCESHGTVVASIIGAAPYDPAARPIPRPAGVAAPPAPAAPPPAPPFPTSTPPPPPPPTTVTVIVSPPAPPPPPPEDAPPPPDAPQAGGPTDNKQAIVPPHPPGAPDGVVGVAPDATLISIRQSSPQFGPAHPSADDEQAHRKAGDIITLARAIRHAADMGVRVLNVSVASCINAAAPVNQDALGAAVRYAAVDKDVVIVTAAGNVGDQQDCGQNPAFDPLHPDDPRDWHEVKTIVAPAWYSDYVLAVGAVNPDGQPMPDSIAGPWVGIAAPGWRIMGLSRVNGAAVNALPDKDPGMANGFWGTSFSAAYVSGVAALVRAKFPNLTAHQVIRRLTDTAHNPPRGVDNQVGYGVVDPVAALTFDVPVGDPAPREHLSSALHVPPVPPGRDMRPRYTALFGALGALLVGGVIAAGAAMRRRMR